MSVSRFDHVAIPARDPVAMIRFYGALGFQVPEPEAWAASGERMFTIQFGDNKINVHAPPLWTDPRFTLRAPEARPGCGDFCFVWEGSAEELMAALERAGAPVEEGPVPRAGGRNAGRDTGTSVYTRDPEGNLLEFMVYP